MQQHKTNPTENSDNLVPQAKIDKPKRLDIRTIEESNPNTEKTLIICSKPSLRKYPTGNGIGGWIRPLRRKK